MYNLKAHKKMKVTKVFDSEVCVKNSFKFMYAINVIARKDEVININEKDNTFSTMKMSERRVVRSRLFAIQGKK